MTTYTSYDLVEFGKPLVAREREMPEPSGTQVLLRVRRSGVCHSDLHIAEGFFDLGEEGRFYMAARGMKLPMALGHEILGEIVAAGPEAEGAEIGKTMLVHPWIGCGECRACDEGRENECTRMRALGVVRDGGYATHVLVDDPKWLVDVEGLDPDTVTPYSCSGVTVFNALKKAGPLHEGEWLAIMGAGGLGLNAIAIARAMGFQKIVSVDIDDRKLQAAAEMGADAVLNGGREDALEELRRITGNQLLSVVDTVGAPSTARLGIFALIKMGRYVVVGLYGGDLKVPLPWIPQKYLTIQGSYVGSCNDLRELIALVKAGKVKEIPVTSRPIAEVSQTLDDLRDGKITGRVVLSTE
ncbi:MAG TPA: alcohol dehydrogenase [Thermohalobaculum sp.]|nr:alcohol dehydrogenase [Thermohalobaculum sp.]